MGKRSSFERKARDFYPTPDAGVLPLVRYLKRPIKYVEPCAGNGALIRSLEWRGGYTCVAALDIEPKWDGIRKADALELSKADVKGSDVIITNPPWGRDILHPMIERFMSLRPTWLLFDADWMHTKQASALIKNCVNIISVGRLKWIPGSKHTGKDNCAWYLFKGGHSDGPQFIGRTN